MANNDKSVTTNRNHFKSIVSGLINDPRIPHRLTFADVVDIMISYDNLARHLGALKLSSKSVNRLTEIPIIKVSDFSMNEDRSLLPEPCENWHKNPFFENLTITGENMNYLNVPCYDYPVVKHESFDAADMYKFRRNTHTHVKPSSFSNYFTCGRKARPDKINLKRRFSDGYKHAKNKFSIRQHFQWVNSFALMPDQIYHLGQTKLYWRSLPAKKSEGSILDDSSHRDQLTVLFCTNVIGSHKLRPLVVGSSSDPRVVQNFEAFVVYKYSKDGQVTSTVLNEWFFEHFVPEVCNKLIEQKLPQRIMLALDPSINWPPPITQLISDRYNIKTVKLSDTIAVDQAVVGLARIQYKKRLLLDAVACPHKFTKLSDAVVLIRLAWDRVKSFDIDKCCQNILANEDKSCFAEYNPTAMLKAVQLQKICIMEIQELLSYLPGGSDLVRSEIDNWIYFDQGLIINKNPFF